MTTLVTTVRRILWPPWQTEAVQALNYALTVVIGLILAWPTFDTFAEVPKFGWLFIHLADREDLIGEAMVALGLLGSAALWFNWHRVQRIAIAVAGCLWVAGAAAFWVTEPHGIAWAMELLLALSCLWAIARLAVDTKR
jgi:hypothetical protein